MFKAGGTYRVTQSFDVNCLFHYRAPFTSGAAAHLPAGLVVKLDPDPAVGATAIYAHPAPYDEWESFFVPDQERGGRYDGYSLVIDHPQLEQRCEPAAEGASAGPYQLTRLKAIEGCLLGTAVGDALGLPFEGMEPRRIARFRLKPLRHRFLFGLGMLSDDTEHAAMVAQCLVESAGNADVFARLLGMRLRWWLAGLPAGIGLATLRALIKLWLGFNPRRSGVFSAGNGPAMRSPVIGAYTGDRLALMTELVTASTGITHSDPKARRGALIAAWLAARAAAGEEVSVNNCLERLEPFVEGESELHGLFASVVASVQAGSTALEFCRKQGWKNGVSGYIYHSMAVVLHIVLRHPQDMEAALGEAIACGGDTDTVAAILGGIIGAGVGREGIPEEWLSGLKDWPRSVPWLRKVARELAFADLGGEPRPAPGVFPPGVMVRNALFMVWVLAHGFRRLLPPYNQRL